MVGEGYNYTKIALSWVGVNSNYVIIIYKTTFLSFTDFFVILLLLLVNAGTAAPICLKRFQHCCQRNTLPRPVSASALPSPILYCVASAAYKPKLDVTAVDYVPATISTCAAQQMHGEF